MSSAAANSGNSAPSWQATVIAIALIALVAGIFIAVFLKSGTDDALKVWGGIGTLVGVLAGAIPTYFFQQANVQAAQAPLAAANAAAAASRDEAQKERARADTVRARYSALAGAADPGLVNHVETSHPALFERESGT